MSEDTMVTHMNEALERFGVADTVSVVGQFSPRGTSGGYFVGGMSMVVGVSDTMVYGVHAQTRSSDPDRLVFGVKRDGLRSVVHQRGMVRVLELIHEDTDSTIELEGSRVPVTHAKEVMDALASTSP